MAAAASSVAARFPFLGHLPLLGSLPHRKLRSMAEAHGLVMLLWFGRVPTVVASSAAAVQEAMRTRDLAFASRARVRMAERLIFGRNMLLAPYGRQARRVSVLHLSPRRIASFRGVLEQEVAALLDRVQRRRCNLLMSYANGVISCTAFAEDREKRREIGKLTSKARNQNLKGKACLDQGLAVNVSTGKSSCGRKKIEVDVSTLQDLPLLRRTTIQDVATHFGVSTSKVHKMKHEGTIKHVSNAMKPYLAEKNRVDRLKWCLAMLDPRSIPGDPIFKVLFNYIFIDEKWFNITRKTERYYVAPGDEQPVDLCVGGISLDHLLSVSFLYRRERGESVGEE
uniref:Uncharacterized protein n=1 Tax=Oryza meridionalis TaxID=40149 RepID=A0A0E0CML3_9ORYZ